jgi:hypothetical protein
MDKNEVVHAQRKLLVFAARARMPARLLMARTLNGKVLVRHVVNRHTNPGIKEE